MNLTQSLGGLALALLATASSAAGVNVNVIVEGQIKPGVYGRVEVGSPSAPPPVWQPQPVIIAPQPQVVEVVPVYMHVPPGHAKAWRKHCHRYDACGRPVYFVKSAEYEPGYGKKRRHHKEHGDDRDDRRNDRGDHKRGHGGRD
jgi:hypothetical protein